MNNPVAAALAQIDQAIATAEAELARLKAARQALGAAAPAPSTAKARPGELAESILAVLPKKGGKAMSNGEIRAALLANGYAHALSQSHVSKTITPLVRAKKVKRVGTRATAAYTLP